jgi:Mg2+/Co2+ transporter CorB
LDTYPIGALLWALAALLVVSGFFSMSETAMMALNRYRLRHLVKQGRRGARKTAELLAKTDRLLGVILLGNTLVNAAAATLTGLITFHYFREDRWAQGIGTLLITFALLVFSEITPKVIGAAYAESIALHLSFVLKPLLWVAYPAVWFVNLFVRALLSLLHLQPGAESQNPRLSAEELRFLVLEAGNFIPKKHQSILLNLFDLEHITIEDVMTPTAKIESIDLEAALETIQRQLATSYHTRLLAYRGGLDEIAGILHLRRVFGAANGEAVSKSMLEELLIPAYFVPATTPALTQLGFFQENHERLGLVVDEYGELQGLVTLEDIVEEMIGEFTTSVPTGARRLTWDADGSALVEGGRQLRELNRKLGLTLPLDGPKTLSGLIVEYLQDIPESGVCMVIGGCRMEIVQTQDRIVKVVRLLRTTSILAGAAPPAVET